MGPGTTIAWSTVGKCVFSLVFTFLLERSKFTQPLEKRALLEVRWRTREKNRGFTGQKGHGDGETARQREGRGKGTLLSGNKTFALDRRIHIDPVLTTVYLPDRRNK